MNMEKTGAYLASLRKGRDMTQQQVADILGVSNKTVSKWESGAVLKEPLVRDRGFRFALYGGCGLLFAVEIVRILVCWKPATVYAATVSTAESVMISRYADLSAVAWPLETVRWIALAAVVAAWLVWGMQAYRHAKKN